MKGKWGTQQGIWRHFTCTCIVLCYQSLQGPCEDSVSVTPRRPASSERADSRELRHPHLYDSCQAGVWRGQGATSWGEALARRAVPDQALYGEVPLSSTDFLSNKEMAILPEPIHTWKPAKAC